MIETEINCDGLLARLREEIVGSYDTGESGTDIDSIVDDLLALQRKTTKITKGTIGVTGDIALQVTNRTILASFLQLQEGIGGFLYVDNDWKLQWPTDIGEDKGQQIRFRKNLIGIDRDIDYSRYCTKLHLQSGGESLSDISVGPVDVTITTDATYAYATLKETYAAYKDYTTAGHPLPDNVTIWKQLGAPAWVVPSSTISGTHWNDEADGRDDDWDTYAYSDDYDDEEWSDYLVYGITSGWYSQVKFKWHEYGEVDKIEISVSLGGADWYVVYSGAAGGAKDSQGTYSFEAREFDRVRLRFLTGTWGAVHSINLYEMHFLQESLQDDSANWEQGDYENIIRCAIGDYDALSTYQISYTYADYLMAWDKINSPEDIVGLVESNKFEAYAMSLLEAGILMLDELKEIPITYRLNTLDLSVNQDFDFSFEALQIGSIVNIIDEDLGIDVSARVIKKRKPDLLSPQIMEIEIATRLKDINIYLAELRRRFS